MRCKEVVWSPGLRDVLREGQTWKDSTSWERVACDHRTAESFSGPASGSCSGAAGREGPGRADGSRPRATGDTGRGEPGRRGGGLRRPGGPGARLPCRAGRAVAAERPTALAARTNSVSEEFRRRPGAGDRGASGVTPAAGRGQEPGASKARGASGACALQGGAGTRPSAQPRAGRVGPRGPGGAARPEGGVPLGLGPPGPETGPPVRLRERRAPPRLWAASRARGGPREASALSARCLFRAPRRPSSGRVGNSPGRVRAGFCPVFNLSRHRPWGGSGGLRRALGVVSFAVAKPHVTKEQQNLHCPWQTGAPFRALPPEPSLSFLDVLGSVLSA
ncbi:uncharacterized protein LOC141575016 [Camelus bactrianus]|uniref:Uncharacterized protein LOC141575016 n=1 Tax=Camelus bactrianus TaxID=9837 RepID=A0AC58PG98_CAMBA